MITYNHNCKGGKESNKLPKKDFQAPYHRTMGREGVENKRTGKRSEKTRGKLREREREKERKKRSNCLMVLPISSQPSKVLVGKYEKGP